MLDVCCTGAHPSWQVIVRTGPFLLGSKLLTFCSYERVYRILYHSSGRAWGQTQPQMTAKPSIFTKLCNSIPKPQGFHFLLMQTYHWNLNLLCLGLSEHLLCVYCYGSCYGSLLRGKRNRTRKTNLKDGR